MVKQLKTNYQQLKLPGNNRKVIDFLNKNYSLANIQNLINIIKIPHQLYN